MTKRRAPNCQINYCCPYRSKLCQSVCGRERVNDFAGADGFIMVVMGDECLIRKPSENKLTRFIVPNETKELFCAHDRGESMAGRTMVLTPADEHEQ